MDFNEVAVFAKVVQSGSFSAAAKQLGMPNSTVSHKVSMLEARLGVTLIQRTTRKLQVTAAGQAYFQRSMQGLEQIAAAEMEIAATQGEPKGLLRITAPAELGSTVLPGLISKYTQTYPLTSVEVILTERRVDLLSESVDLAIRAGELRDSSLIVKKIGSVYFAPFAAPKYLKVRGEPTQPKDLRAHACLQFAPIGTEQWSLSNGKTQLHIPIPGRVTVNDLNMLKALTLMGDGIALLPAFFCYQEVKLGKLVRVLPQWKTTTNSVHFVYPAQRFVMPKLSAFIEMASDTLKQSFDSFEL